MRKLALLLVGVVVLTKVSVDYIKEVILEVFG